MKTNLFLALRSWLWNLGIWNCPQALGLGRAGLPSVLSATLVIQSCPRAAHRKLNGKGGSVSKRATWGFFRSLLCK